MPNITLPGSDHRLHGATEVDWLVPSIVRCIFVQTVPRMLINATEFALHNQYIQFHFTERHAKIVNNQLRLYGFSHIRLKSVPIQWQITA